MSSRIEQIIGEIEEYVDSCKFQPLSTTKIVVNKEEIEELLRELRLKTCLLYTSHTWRDRGFRICHDFLA